MAEGGKNQINIPNERLLKESSANLAGYIECQVISTGGCAFQRAGLEDMAEGGKNQINIGDYVWIEEFSGRPVRDKEGRQTLYHYVNEHQVIAKVNK
jgi:hypothetical protein